MQFSPFFVFRPCPKHCFFTLRGRPKVDFLRFFAFGRARNAVFVVFCSSEPSESHFSLFSVHPRPRKAIFFCFFAHPRPRKAIFYRFLLIRDLGKLFFSVFFSSEPSESHFFLFSAHPRPRKAISYRFLFIRALGKPFFSVFCSSEPSESCFFYLRRPSGTPILRITLQRKEKYRI